jgi:GT2 family glycosyltransferase
MNDAQPKDTSPAKVSVIIPIYGRLGDSQRLIDRLRRQTLLPREIILVDSSPTALESVPSGVRYLRNPVDLALSGDYNHGAQHATGDYLLLMQQDCLPGSDADLDTNLALLTDARVAVTSSVTLPKENWEQYGFWGQALMARWVGTFKQGISGKFDLIRADVFRKINGYDTRNFRYAGEDIDLYLRLSQEGEVHVAPTQVIHLHNQSVRTGWRDLVKKQFQLAESFGALFRRHGLRLRRVPYAANYSHHLAKILYPLIPLCFAWPQYFVPLLIVGANFTNAEVWRIESPRKLLFLILNPVLFLVGAAGTLRGLLTGTQRYSVNK